MIKVPLLKQMLMFWQFKDNEMLDTILIFTQTKKRKNGLEGLLKDGK